MYNIKLDVQQFTENGSAHAELNIDGKSVGMLYLSEGEKNVLIKALEAAQREVDEFAFTALEPEDDDQEIDIDIFD